MIDYKQNGVRGVRWLLKQKEAAMDQEDLLLWQQMTKEQRQRAMAILVEMLLRQAASEVEEASDERGE